MTQPTIIVLITYIQLFSLKLFVDKQRYPPGPQERAGRFLESKVVQ